MPNDNEASDKYSCENCTVKFQQVLYFAYVEVEVDVDVDLDLDIDATTLKTFRPGGGISRERGGARQRARACGSSRSPPTPSPLPPSTHVLCPKQTGASRLLVTGSQIRRLES